MHRMHSRNSVRSKTLQLHTSLLPVLWHPLLVQNWTTWHPYSWCQMQRSLSWHNAEYAKCIRKELDNALKSFALSLYHNSRKAYSLFQQFFRMPSASTLRKAMASLDIQPGISDQMIEFFKLKVKTMSVQELLSLLSADEVSLKIWFDVNPQRDLVEGYEDYEKYGRTKKPADHALVFMVEGMSLVILQSFFFMCCLWWLTVISVPRAVMFANIVKYSNGYNVWYLKLSLWFLYFFKMLKNELTIYQFKWCCLISIVHATYILQCIFGNVRHFSVLLRYLQPMETAYRLFPYKWAMQTWDAEKVTFWRIASSHWYRPQNQTLCVWPRKEYAKSCDESGCDWKGALFHLQWHKDICPVWPPTSHQVYKVSKFIFIRLLYSW